MTELNRYQIYYIEENTGKMPVKTIAKHLGVAVRLWMSIYGKKWENPAR